jgi:hypothetical protein
MVKALREIELCALEAPKHWELSKRLAVCRQRQAAAAEREAIGAEDDVAVLAELEPVPELGISSHAGRFAAVPEGALGLTRHTL